MSTKYLLKQYSTITVYIQICWHGNYHFETWDNLKWFWYIGDFVRALDRNKKVKVEINAISNEDKTALDYANDDFHADIVMFLRQNRGRKASRVRG